jgi:THO complex subunit 7
VERRHKEECEAVRKLVASWPPRSETERLITNLQAEIAELEAEDASCVRMLDLRRKQFSLLLHVVCCLLFERSHITHMGTRK